MALLAALASAILLVAFFMGRESARKATQTQPAPIPPQAQAVQPASSQPTEPSQAAALGPASSSLEMPPPAPGPGQVLSMPATSSSGAPTPTAQATSTPPVAQDKLHDEVARYFREVETIQSQAKASGDPETFARTLLEQGVKGDASGFDGLVAANRKVLEALRGVQVPEPCREHHRLTLRLLEQSIAMLDNVKGQLQGGNEASLAALPAQGQELERGAKEADALAADIKRRFGL
jgi:hypothetical protein